MNTEMTFLIFGSLNILFLIVGIMWGKQKKMEQAQSLSLLASLWAATSAQGLKQSTVIQRIVEKYHPPTAKLDEKQLQEFEKQFSELADLAEEEQIKRRDNIKPLEFDNEFDNVEDLV